MTETSYAKGLEGVIAAESEICQIDGAQGKLYYRGYSIEELAEQSTFEETTYLLLYEKLPTEQELTDFTKQMRQHRDLPIAVRTMIRDFPSTGSVLPVMNARIHSSTATTTTITSIHATM